MFAERWLILSHSSLSACLIFLKFFFLFTFPGKLTQYIHTVSRGRTRPTHSICKPLQSTSNFVTDMGKVWCLPSSSATCWKASWNIRLWHCKISLLHVVLYQAGKEQRKTVCMLNPATPQTQKIRRKLWPSWFLLSLAGKHSLNTLKTYLLSLPLLLTASKAKHMSSYSQLYMLPLGNKHSSEWHNTFCHLLVRPNSYPPGAKNDGRGERKLIFSLHGDKQKAASVLCTRTWVAIVLELGG